MRPLLLLLLLTAATAQAEVTALSATGFTSSFRREVQATPAQAFEAIGRLPQWWNVAHSYSGKAASLRIGLRAGDCFCEDWDGNSIEHARVLLVMRNSLVRLEGSLGPLQELGVNGILTLATGQAEGRTFVRMVYRVAGTPDAGLERLATVVDRVVGDQFARWAQFTESGRP